MTVTPKPPRRTGKRCCFSPVHTPARRGAGTPGCTEQGLSPSSISLRRGTCTYTTSSTLKTANATDDGLPVHCCFISRPQEKEKKEGNFIVEGGNLLRFTVFSCQCVLSVMLTVPRKKKMGLSRPVRCLQPLLAPLLCLPGMEVSLETQKLLKL